MIIIADSGSTKTDWVIVGDDGRTNIKTMGFNPVYHDTELIYREASAGFPDQLDNKQIDSVFFYGAGCWDHTRKEVVARALRRIWPEADVEVDHDLLGAARSTCGRQAGIACIIGTGSNSCLYDGEQVIDNVTNLGHYVGDEGSGAYLGKELVRCYFYREMPADIMEDFEERYPGGKMELLNNIYEEDSQPNVYLATFTRFLNDYRDHIYIANLLYRGLAVFVDRHVRKYHNHFSLPVHFIGSVAYHFQDFLKVILEERDMNVGTFVQRPIDRLVNFHSSIPLS